MPYYETAEIAPNYHSGIMCSAPSCKKTILQKQAALTCSYCKNFYHPPCRGVIGEARIRKAANENWVCSPVCGKGVDSELNTPTSPSPDLYKPSDSSIKGLISRMDAQFAEIKTMIADISKSQEFICREFEEIAIQSKKVADVNEILVQKCEVLKIAYQKQEERINFLEAQLDVPLQKEREKDIVICGIQIDAPDISKFIEDTFRSINSNANITAIEKKKHHNNSKSALRNSFIVTLGSVEMKNDIISKFKKINRISPSSSSSPPKLGYHLLHHFTNFQAKLYDEARKFQRAHNYRFLWIKEGKLFLRKNSDSNIHHIFCQNDIFRLASKTSSPLSPNEQSDVPEST